MAKKKKRGKGLTPEEKKIVKALLEKKERNQDIQALINFGRKDTINFARITEVKQNSKQPKASDEEVRKFKIKKESFDPKTGLNPYDDERLVRSREAMMLAVQVFNNPILHFRMEVFTVLATIAWTYLLHEYYSREKINITKNNKTLPLRKMISHQKSPLSKGMRNNLVTLINIRNKVEHETFKKAKLDFQSFFYNYQPLFQACCLNFNKMLSELFENKIALTNELGIALQFAKMKTEQLAQLQQDDDIPEAIKAVDKELTGKLTDKEKQDPEYAFSIIYTHTSTSKSKAHIKFVHPDSAEGKEISNVLIKPVPADETHPYTPQPAWEEVAKRACKPFNSHDHTKAWKKYRCRPKYGAKNPEKTDKNFCIYNRAYKKYTYSEKWIEFLVDEIKKGKLKTTTKKQLPKSE